jgi:hypothetical protein
MNVVLLYLLAILTPQQEDVYSVQVRATWIGHNLYWCFCPSATFERKSLWIA